MKPQKLLLAALLALALVCPSCLFARKSFRYYTIAPPPPAAQVGFRVEEVKLAAFLNHHEMTYLADSGEVMRISGAKWSQPLGTVVKEYLVSALRPPFENKENPAAQARFFIDRFQMTADGAFHVSGVLEVEAKFPPNADTRRAFAFELPSRGAPAAKTLVAQTQAALERLLAELCGKSAK